MTTTALQDSKALRTKAAKDLAAAQKITAKLGPKVQALTAQFTTAQQVVDENKALIASLDAVFAPKAPLADKADPAPVKAKPGPKPKAAKAAPVAAAPVAPAKPKGKPGPKPKAPVAAAPAKPKGKPGPKPKAPVAAAAPVVKGKPGPKPKAKVEPKTAAKTRAAEGRAAVMSGARPSLKDAMTQVMGTTAMDSAMIYDLLKAKDWLPNAQNPRSYIGYTLSSSKEHFTRVQGKRGFYTAKAAAVVTPAVSAAPAQKTPAASTVKSNGKVASGQTTEQILADAGLTAGGTFGA